MNREQRQALLRSDQKVKTEDQPQGEMYRIRNMSPSYEDDDDGDDNRTLRVQLKTCAGFYINTSWPECPFGLDDVFRSNTELLRYMMMCRMISDRVSSIYVYISTTQLHVL
jgi:hypothetical protein